MVFSLLLVPGGNATELLQPVDCPLHQVAHPVQGTIIMDFGPAGEVPQLKQYDRITAVCEIRLLMPELTVLLIGCNEFVVPNPTEYHNNLERDLLLGCLETHGIHSALMQKFDQHGDKYLQDIPTDVIGTHIALCRYHGGVLFGSALITEDE